jgi:hypothetical protein
VRARVAAFLIPFFAALAVAGTPVLPAASAAAAERAPALGGEVERTPAVASPHGAAQLHAAAREAGTRPGFWKLPPHVLTLRLVATPIPSERTRAATVACAPIAPPSAPRTCRGPPRT